MTGSQGLKTLRKQSWVAVRGIVASGLIVSSGTAWAQPKGPAKPQPTTSASAPSSAAEQEAERHFEKGRELIKEENKWAEALDEFRQAYDAVGKPKYLVKMIEAELAIGRSADAANHLKALLKRKSELDDETLTEANRVLAEQRKKVGAATVTVNVEGAEVLVDGRVVGTSPIQGDVFVAPGRRTFQARKAGFVPADTSMEVAPGSTPKVEVTLKKDEGPGPVGPGRGAGGGANMALVYTGVVVASALAVVGVGTAIGAAIAEKKSEDDWYAADCTKTPTVACYSNYNEQENKRFLLGNTAVWMFIGASTVGVGTLVYALTAKSSEKKPTKQAVCVTPTVGGVLVRGTF